MTAERNLGFFLFTFERKKMKNRFLEALRPCNSFSYQDFREWISALYTESDKEAILKEIRIDGTMTQKGWNLLLIDNARSETLDLREVREDWLGDCNALNWEQWESLVSELLYRDEIQTNLYFGGVADPILMPYASRIIQYITGLDEQESERIVEEVFTEGIPKIIKPRTQIDDYFSHEDLVFPYGNDANGIDMGVREIPKNWRYHRVLDEFSGQLKLWID